MAALRERAEQRVPIGDLLESLLHDTGYIDALKAERTIEAQGREENLAELVEVAREFDATAEDEQDTLDVFLQSVALVADADTRTDDEGLVTLMTLHNAKGLEYPIVFIAGHGGGRLPALARARRGRPGGGAPARLRRHHAGDALAVPDERAPPRRLRRDAVRDALALPRRDPARAHRPRRRARASGLGGVRRRSGRRRGRRRSPRARPRRRSDFRLGDDVSHAAFGAGVVTGVEAGGIVVVRFAGDGSERKLMAEYAPDHEALTRRGPRHGSARSSMASRSPGACGSTSRATSRRSREEFGGARPGLATILVGDDPGSAVYVAGKQKACTEVGMQGFELPAAGRHAARGGRRAHRAPQRRSRRSTGSCCSCRCPSHLDGVELTGMIDPHKDVDGLTPVSAGLLALGREGLRPCTPQGVMTLLDAAGAQLEGAEAVVIGRSNLFGKPMAQLLLGANATVTMCHSRTRDLAAVCRRADVLIAAVGRARMVKADWVKPGATVIDVGMNRTDGRPRAATSTSRPSRRSRGAITPVPGGVGPMTIAFLLRNTLQAARMQRAGERSHDGPAPAAQRRAPRRRAAPSGCSS